MEANIAEEYGKRGEGPWGGLGSGGGFPFHVIGLFRGVIPASARGMVPMPPGCNPSDPVLCFLASHPASLPLLEPLKEALKAATLADLTGAEDAQGGFSVGARRTLNDAASVVRAEGAALAWFKGDGQQEATSSEGQQQDGGQLVGGGDDGEQCVCVIRPEAFARGALGPVFSRAAEGALDVVGMRIVYPSRLHVIKARQQSGASLVESGPNLVIVFRGVHANAVWGEVVGPEDPLVAKMTDSSSLRAIYGITKERNLLRCTRSAERGRKEAKLFFGGSPAPVDDHADSVCRLRLLVPYPVESSVLLLKPGLSEEALATVSSSSVHPSIYQSINHIIYINQFMYSSISSICPSIQGTFLTSPLHRDLLQICTILSSQGLALQAISRRHIDQRAGTQLGVPAWVLPAKAGHTPPTL